MAAPAGPAKPPLADADVLERWNTPDGARLAIRPMRSDDAEQELDFLQSLSTQTLYERTFSHRALAPGELNN